MGREDEREPKDTSGGAEDERRLSAAFLPYDDQRLWVSMPAEDRGLLARLRRRRGSGDEPVAGEPVAGPTAGEPIAEEPSGDEHSDERPRRRWTTIAAILALPILAFAITRVIGGGEPQPTPSTSTTPSLTPSPTVIDIVGLAATRATAERVVLVWDPPAGGDLTYTVYRDGLALGETSDRTFTDADVEPGRSYFYAVATAFPDGTVASTEQLQVDVPTAAGSPTVTPRPTATPSRIVTAPSPSRTPSPSPSPSKSKIVWPSIDLGGTSPGGPTTPPPA